MAHLDFEKPIAELEQRISELRDVASASTKSDAMSVEVRKLEERAKKLQREILDRLSVWQKVLLSRHPDRPYFADYISFLFEDFVEIHGDRAFRDDPAIIAGLGTFRGRHVVLIGQQKGRTTKEKMHRNFGMANPDGYRKAIRVMELADRFRRPILTFIDTAGAYPGIGAEERGQSEAIGQALLTMARLKVPVIATVIGEGGSGGALGLGIANRVLMLEYSTYSVISPEGCASILWRDAARAGDAADQLKLLASDVFKLGVADQVIEEPLGGAHRDPADAAKRVGDAIAASLTTLERMTPAALVEDRYQKFRAIGKFEIA